MSGTADPDEQYSVLGDPLEPCSENPPTGFLRDAHCRSVPRDPGRHEICAVMTADFLDFTEVMGNDLSTPRPELNFPGLEPGDRWCVCVPRWIEAMEGRQAPPVVLESTVESVLDEVSLSTLREHAHEP